MGFFNLTKCFEEILEVCRWYDSFNCLYIRSVNHIQLFVNAASTDPFHATVNVVSQLEKAGFTKLKENTCWSNQLNKNGKYYFTRNQSSVIAFSLGGKYDGSGGISAIAAHTDSPNLRVKPISNRTQNGYLQVKCETYGGGIWHSWWVYEVNQFFREHH